MHNPTSILQHIPKQGLASPHLPAILPVGRKMRFLRIGITAVERLRVRLMVREHKSGGAHALIILRLAHALLDQDVLRRPGPFASPLLERTGPSHRSDRTDMMTPTRA